MDYSTDNFGVLSPWEGRDGSMLVFFAQIVLQGGLGVLQGGLVGVVRLKVESARCIMGVWAF